MMRQRDGVAIGLRLLRLDGAPVGLFDGSRAEARRAVALALFVLAAYLAILGLASPDPEVVSPATGFIVQFATVAIQWCATPVAASFLAPALGLGDRLFRFLTIWSYGTVALLIVMVGLTLGLALPALGGLALFLIELLPFYAVAYWAVAARAALGCGWGPAIGLALLDLVVSLVAVAWGTSILYPTLVAGAS